MEKVNNTGKIYSFYQLISDYKIEVPIIQRDYAQGREDMTEIRDSFLSALKSAIDSRQSELKLDFVYGSIVNGSFQPLDGQQRLTTLFLLHWYAAYKMRDNDTKDESNSVSRGILSKFTYETRISSRDFCHALINNDIIKSANSDIKQISEAIINSPWFFLSWKKDPTIKAMLRTIDDIDHKFSEIEDLWDILVSENSPINFYFVLLEDIGLTDDLYIKMNARGKLLSHFENFKAGFQKYIQDSKWEDGKDLSDTFAFKIDTNWTDFFWNNYRVNDSIDESFMRFISTVTMIQLSVERSANDRITLIQKLNDNHNNIRQSLITKETYEYLYNCFEIYVKKLSELRHCRINFPLWRHALDNPEGNYLEQIVNPKQDISYSNKALFYAQTCYLSLNDVIREDKYLEWMRIVRNIISRANLKPDGTRTDIVRSPEAFDGAINLITELAKGCSDIYAHLSSGIKIASAFAKNQVEEECLKAKLIAHDLEYKDIIWKLEDTDLLMGRIEFALFCCDYHYSFPDCLDKNKLNSVADVIIKYIGKKDDVELPMIRRALLTIDYDRCYEYYNYWSSVWNVTGARKRRLIDKYGALEFCIYHNESREYFKKLVNKLCETDSLQEIINAFNPPVNMPNWKVRLIKESGHIDSNFSNFIAIPDDESCCYLLCSIRPRELDGNTKIE